MCDVASESSGQQGAAQGDCVALAKIVSCVVITKMKENN